MKKKKKSMTCYHKQIDLQKKTFVVMPCFETIKGCCGEVIFTTHAYKSRKPSKKYGDDNN